MSGTSKAVLSICVLLLAALVVYYGMTPPTQPSLTVGDIPSRTENDVQLFGRNLDAAAAALGIPPAVVEITQQPSTHLRVEDEPEIALTEPMAEPVVEGQVQETEKQPTIEHVTFYTVMPGDTLGGISLEMFGSTKYASEIASFNGISDPRNIQPGRELRIPEVKQSTPVHDAAGTVIPAGSTTHVIQSGETLSDIAENYLGTPHMWHRIWKANTQRISNPDRLKVGTRIVIPS